jgi:hypothetical protein
MARCLVLLSTAGVAAAGGAGLPGLFSLMDAKDGEGNYILDYVPVAAMMGFIIVFTITMEKLVAKVKRWVEYFNPLLQPVVDKVIAELMILGATAFLILLTNEATDQSLANGTFMPVNWYLTLHWIDTTIFIFAIVYVAAASFYLGGIDPLTNTLAQIDVEPKMDAVDAGLVASVTAELERHLARKGSRTEQRALPPHAIELVIGAAHHEDHQVHEQQVKEYLCDPRKVQGDFHFSGITGRHLMTVLQPLVNLNVVSCKERARSRGKHPNFHITKNPVGTWAFTAENPEAAEKTNKTGLLCCLCAWWERCCALKHMQYVLVKRHFLKSFFGDATFKVRTRARRRT